MLTLIVKVTRRCNLRCLYCNDWRSEAPIMSQDLIRVLLSRAFEAPSSSIHFNWHGGEPTLMGVDYFNWIFETQRSVCPKEKRFTNTIQTNGTRLSDTWLDAIQQAGVSVGVSLDGPQVIHDQTRPNIAGRGSYTAVMETIGRLQERGIAYGVTIVASDELLALGPEALWDFLVSRDFRHVNVIPVRPPNRVGGHVITPTVQAEFLHLHSWAQFQLRLWELWEASRTDLRIAAFDAVQRKLRSGVSTSCLIGGTCIGSIFGVDQDGTLMHCELFQGLPTHAFGNIRDLAFAEVLSSPQLLTLKAEQAARFEAYASCPAFGVCSGGCPHEWTIHETYGFAADVARCCGWRPLIERIAADVGAELPRSSINATVEVR